MLTVAFTSCKATRSVPPDQYLLSRVKIVTDEKPNDISKSTINRYVRQHPNSKVLGMRVGLGVYNLARPTPKYKFGHWLQKIGEAPVIYDENLTLQSVENIRLYLNSRGFYACEVHDTTYRHGKQRMAVEYKIKFGEPTLIDTVHYTVKDTATARFVNAARKESLLQPGERLDKTLLDAERSRLATVLRSEGFYNFSSEWVGFLADTLGAARRASLTLRIPHRSHTPQPALPLPRGQPHGISQLLRQKVRHRR